MHYEKLQKIEPTSTVISLYGKIKCSRCGKICCTTCNDKGEIFWYCISCAKDGMIVNQKELAIKLQDVTNITDIYFDFLFLIVENVIICKDNIDIILKKIDSVSSQEELKNLFNDMGYWNTPITNKAWDCTQIFDETEFQRIVDNTNVLRNAFFVYNDTPSTPPVSYHYNDINALEKILYDLDVMISDVKSHYRECGTFECGEE